MASSGSIDQKYNDTLGIIQNVGNLNKGFYTSRLDAGVPICLDNQAYTDSFEEDEWLKALDKLRKYKDQCLFVVIPDEFGNCEETIKKFHHYKDMASDFPKAFVAQDRIMDYKNDIPWSEFDCIFIGGNDSHRLGRGGGWAVKEGKRRDKWVHVGRVNSARRVIRFWQADSWDGTHLNHQPSDARKFHEAVLQVRAMKSISQFDFTDWIGVTHPEVKEDDDVGYWNAKVQYTRQYGDDNI